MRPLPLAILALGLAFASSFAQTPPDSWENLKNLDAGHKIKVVDVGLKAWDGRLVSVSDQAITIRPKGGEVTVERAKVFRVTDLERSRRGRNAAIGLLAGALLYAAVNRGSGDDAEHALSIGFMGGIGAAAGAAIPYPRPTIYIAKHKSEKSRR